MAHPLVGIAVWLLGLCIGSFLNVVICRLPAGGSVLRPLRSFCPSCGCSLAWFDNLPLVSWAALRARCRQCRAPISVQYPLVEALCGLAFVLVYVLLFVLDARRGLEHPTLPRDLALLAAWLVLVAALLACSALDLQYYMVDVRITDCTVAAAVVLYALWPRPEHLSGPAAAPAGAAALTAFLSAGLMLWLTVWRSSEQPASPGVQPAPETSGGQPEEAPGAAPDRSLSPQPSPAPSPDIAAQAPHGEPIWPGAIAAALAVVAALLLLGTLCAGDLAGQTLADGPDHGRSGPQADTGRWLLRWLVPGALTLFFGVTVLAAAQPRPADQEIHAAVEQERPQARRSALRELLWLAPIIVAAAAAAVVASRIPPWGEVWRTLATWQAPGGFVPVAGAIYAMSGAMIAAAAGWTLRIVFTLALGREAFGTGDIYLLAAAGAAGGWDIAVLGLFLAALLALAGWLIGMLLKRSLMIPFGPWLAIGLVGALWVSRPAGHIVGQYVETVRQVWESRPDILLVAGGVMLVGVSLSLALGQLIRRLVEPGWPAPAPPAAVTAPPPANAVAREHAPRATSEGERPQEEKS